VVKIKVAIDLLFLRPNKVGGTESYLRNLLKGFQTLDDKNNYYLFVSKNNCRQFEIDYKNFNVIKCSIDNSNRLKRLLYQNYRLPQKIKKVNPDIMFFPTYTRCLNKLNGIKVISNIHDLQYKYYPEYFNIAKKIIFNIFYSVSIKKSDYLITISDSVKDDINKFFGDKYKNKMKTIHNPIDFDKISKRNYTGSFKKIDVEKTKYILSVASLLPHKNITTLIKAFNYYEKKNNSNFKLVLVGLKDKSTNKITKLLSKFNLENKVIIPGYVSNEVLASLYSNALLFISPSKFEGFGMPPIEAMYNKIPVITTRCASLPEVTLEQAYYYDPPEDYEKLANKINEVINNYPSDEKLNKIAGKAYKNYNLKKIAQEYINFFEEVLNN
jgi:glycosyltransferase involved in cell wall biosynthesis